MYKDKAFKREERELVQTLKKKRSKIEIDRARVTALMKRANYRHNEGLLYPVLKIVCTLDYMDFRIIHILNTPKNIASFITYNDRISEISVQSIDGVELIKICYGYVVKISDATYFLDCLYPLLSEQRICCSMEPKGVDPSFYSDWKPKDIYQNLDIFLCGYVQEPEERKNLVAAELMQIEAKKPSPKDEAIPF